jgi:conjugative relaxase-like TrwC/TraI family protein
MGCPRRMWGQPAITAASLTCLAMEATRSTFRHKRFQAGDTMLRIHPVTSATDAKSYYASSDYYTEGQELIGRWGGTLARRLGLAGTVDKPSFDRMCDNLHPTTGRPLTPRTNDERRVGYDFVFSAPKSFSDIEALASEDERSRLLSAFDASVEETMEEVEADMRTRVRLGGERSDRVTGNMVWAAFRHSTSRPVGDAPPDPHRHTHVLVFNATHDQEEGRIKAGEFGFIKRDGEYYTAAFYARLARKLEGLGYVIDRQGGKEWEIAGVPRSVIDKFSKRTKQIEAEAERRGITDPERKSGLGAKTRAKKQKELAPEQLHALWDEQLTHAERTALAAVYRREIAPGEKVTVAQAVTHAVAHCFERESVVPEREIRRVALLYGLGHVTPEQLDDELPRHGVITGDQDGRTMATTRELLAEERFLTGFAAAGRGTQRPAGVALGLERGQLDGDQWNAVKGLLDSTDRVNLVDSVAGTGKSTMLKALDKGLRLAGENVTYLATTTQAVEVLRKDGFQAETVAKFLMSVKMQEAARGGRVVIDEASMLGHKDAYRLFAAAKEGGMRLDMLGDSRQHGSVARGALMRVLQEYGGLKPFRLSAIKRQEGMGYKRAVELFSQGKALDGFDALDRLGWVRQIREGDRNHAIASDYVQALNDGKTWDEVLVISPTHAEGEAITGAIRGMLRREGRLGKDEREFTRLVAANLTEAERGDSTHYRPGEVDVLQFHQNAKGYKIGERIVVGDAEAAGLPLDQTAKFQAYRVESIALAEGDVIRFTAGGKTADGKHRLNNGTAYRVEGFTPQGDIRLANGWVVGSNFGHFRHGYVETSFGSQGKTVHRVIIGQSSQSFPASNMEQIYVSASRAREMLRLYTDDKEELREAVARSSAKLAATDLIEAKQSCARPRPRKRMPWREHQARLQRAAILSRARAASAADRARQLSAERQALR